VENIITITIIIKRFKNSNFKIFRKFKFY